jgi:hypothetical protein
MFLRFYPTLRAVTTLSREFWLVYFWVVSLYRVDASHRRPVSTQLGTLPIFVLLENLRGDTRGNKKRTMETSIVLPPKSPCPAAPCHPKCRTRFASRRTPAGFALPVHPARAGKTVATRPTKSSAFLSGVGSAPIDAITHACRVGRIRNAILTYIFRECKRFFVQKSGILY